jgi:dolichol-phosphate mannosyltransferase
MRTLVIIPTYNERDNIVPLVDRILRLPGELEVLVVDDGSPDGTASALQERHSDDPRVHLIQRGRKLGLGTAYTAGFRYALENGYRFCITMDSDFSHDPGHIPELCRAAEGNDLVVGSRYVPGGRTVNWGWWRRLISRTANLFAHNLVALQHRDCTSGFRLYRSEALRIVDFQSIVADGYSYLVEILHRVSVSGLRVAEVPITFVERRQGKSKISRKEIFKAIHTMLRLRFDRGWKSERERAPV